MSPSLPHLNLTQKYIGFLFMVSIFPLLFVGASNYQVSRSVIREQATQYTAELVYDQRDYLDLQLAQIENLIANISSVETIIQALDDEKASTDAFTNLATQARIGYILDGYTNLNGLVSIDIFTLNHEVHYHMGDTLDVSIIRNEVKERILNQAKASDRKVVWTGIEENVNGNSSYHKVLTAARLLYKTDSLSLQAKPVALLLVNYSVDSLYDHFKPINLGEGAYLMVVDSEGRVIYHPDKNLLSAKVNPEFIKKLSSESGYFLDSTTGENLIVTFNKSSLSGWSVVSFIPMRTLMGRVAAIGAANVIVLTLSFVVVTISAWLVSRTLVAPLRQITNQFRRFQLDSLKGINPLPEAGHDEIGELIRWFNTFLYSLKAKQKTEAALRESEERYFLAVRGANDGIWDWDLRTDSIHYSPRLKEMLGFSTDVSGNGKTNSPYEWLNRIHPTEVETVKAAIHAHLEGETPHFQSEHRILLHDGKTYGWFLARGLAVWGEDGIAYRLAGSLTDITQRKTVEERLWHEAMYDSLTQLPNRSFFMDHLRRSIVHAHRHPKYHAAVLFLDLDRFKIINDSLGHTVGDDMLVKMAERLVSCLRTDDIVARFGGDEFAVLLNDLRSITDATRIARRIQKELSQPFVLQGHRLFASASIGIAEINAKYECEEDILRDADTAMYRAKANGRARYEIFDAEMHSRSLALLRMEADLRKAIEREEFRLFYQPILSLRNGNYTAMEALIRWKHPEHGLISPGDFIDLAEETGLIEPIGEWVLRKACAQVREWRAAGLSDLVVSVNISARQLKTRKLVQIVQRALKEAEVPASALQLEITESAAMLDLELTVSTLKTLNAMGVLIAIDDFGISYSSLGYLKRFPVGSIKIDRSFIHEITSNRDNEAITNAMIAMAHILDLKVVAEGVETQAELGHLSALGCDEIQGYLVSRPAPPEELTCIYLNSAELANLGKYGVSLVQPVVQSDP